MSNDLQCAEGLFRNRAPSSVSFEQDLDLVLSQLTHLNRPSQDHGMFIEKTLTLCEYEQIRYLWTVLEPFMHRDFLFSKMDSYPKSDLSTLSTYISRELHIRLEKAVSRNKKKSSYRIPSSFIRNEHDVESWKMQSVLPALDKHNITQGVETQKNRSAIRGAKMDPKHVISKSEVIRLPTLRAKSEMYQRTQSLHDIPLNSQAKKRHLQEKEMSKLKKVNTDLESLWSSHERSHYHLLRKAKSAGNMKTHKEDNFAIRNHTAKSFFRDVSKKERLKHDQEVMKMLSFYFGGKWDDYQRKRFLQVFVQTLQPSDLLHLYGRLMVRMNRDFISLLPEDLSTKILILLCPEELCTAAKVSRTWNILSSSDVIWREKCRGKYIGIPLDTNLSYKQTFLKNRRLLCNRSKGRYEVQELNSGLSSVTTFRFEGNILAVAGEKMVKVWNMQKNRQISTLIGHQKGVWSLRFYSSFFLLSSSNDQTIKMWNFESGACLRTFVGHDGGVWTIETKKNILVSGSVDKTAKVWDLRNPQLLVTLRGHGGAVSSVDMDNSTERVFTASTDKIIRIWNRHEEYCQHTIPIEDDASTLTIVSFSENYLLCAAGVTMQLWSVHPNRKTKLVKEFHGPRSKVEVAQLSYFERHGNRNNSMLVAGSTEGKIKCWNPASGETIFSTKPMNTCVSCLQFDDVKIVISFSDPIIKIWNFL